MANSYHHAVSSARRFGGVPEDYQPLHDWMDRTKSAWADSRHRAILHNTFGIFLGEERFGHTIPISNGRLIAVRPILEQHVIEDCSFIPTLEDWLQGIPRTDWMVRGALALSEIQNDG